MASIEGWLTKEGGSHKSWKKRWCILKKDGILTYAAAEGGKPKGELDIKLASHIKKNVERKDKKFYFEVVMPDRTWCFTAESQVEKEKWIGWLQTFAKPTAAIEDFELLVVVGKGSFGKVMQVRHKGTKEIYAMKVLDKKHILDHNEVEHTMAEKNILQQVQHPFLMNLHWSFQSSDKLYFVLDYVNGGELFYHLQRDKRFSLPRTTLYSAEILLALEHLHINGIVYRDLKPENILIQADGHLCLTDFGLAKQGMEDAQRTLTFCGTPEYLAPEVLKGKGYNKAVDWWSFGAVIYEMLSGLPPFYSTDVQDMYKKIMSMQVKFPEHMNADTRDIIAQFLDRDPDKRLCQPEKMKQHPFYKDLDWAKVLSRGYTPEFVPKVKSKDSIQYVDSEFTSEAAGISVSEGSGEATNFQGFTYVAEQK